MVIDIINHNFDKEKPLCVFGVMNTQRGLEIRDSMLSWLIPSYWVKEILHDGTEYEYPALHFLQTWCIDTGRPALYIHTKGAAIYRPITKHVHNMWKQEFIGRQREYFDTISSDKPIVACPLTGNDRTTWYNGFVTNAAAMKALPTIMPNENRWYFERLFKYNPVAEVMGLVLNDVHRTDVDKQRMINYILQTY